MDIFTRFKKQLKLREVLLDNEVFQLHYRVTALLLLGCAALVASKQHFGDPIDCITRDDVPPKIMDTYCWIHSTFTLPNSCNKTVGIEVAHPCVDKSSLAGGDAQEERVYHKYYQWVYFVLFFQATCFYAPHFFWKMFESRLLSRLTSKFKDPLFKLEEQRAELDLIVTYLVRNRHRHESYFRYFALFELLNFVNVILQIYLVDEFLGGTFTRYGLDVLNYVQLPQDDRMDPMVRVFPRMTKCTFHRFGASGDVQRYDALCILPLNIINEKIYIIMWFWFVFLAILTAFWLVYRLLTFTQPRLRYRVIRRRASLANRAQLNYVLKRLRAGDWFVLSMMCKNMDSQWFRYLLRELFKSLRAVELQRRSVNGASKGSRAKRPNEFQIGHSGKEKMLAHSDAESAANEDEDADLDSDGGSNSEPAANKPTSSSVAVDLGNK